MKILITGISGFIGQELGWQIFKEGHELVALSRSPERLETENPFPVKAYAWSSQIEKASSESTRSFIWPGLQSRELAGQPKKKRKFMNLAFRLQKKL